jgi:predicted Zn-dependent protease
MANIFNRNLFRLMVPLLIVALFGGQVAEARHREVLSKVGSLVTPVSQQQEVHMGAQLDGTIRERYPASENYALQEYVSSIGKKVGAVTNKNYPFTYTVLDDKRSANAYAAPGGFIYVTTGLINMLENESQLAAVLAHETAHVTNVMW